MIRRFKKFVIGIAYLLCGALLIYINSQSIYHSVLLVVGGEIVEGRVTKVDWRSRRRDLSVVYIEFQDDNGAKRQLESDVGLMEFFDPEPGELVEVKYLPRNHDVVKRNTISHFYLRPVLGLLVGMFLVFLFSVEMRSAFQRETESA